jgi:NAD(P)-dependent dehydrogenase (short-subunit alcohol dehydrogenase family)
MLCTLPADAVDSVPAAPRLRAWSWRGWLLIYAPAMTTSSTSETPVSVVTGANSGIGRATAIHLASQGHTVYGTVRATSKAEKLRAMSEQAGVEVHLVELDVADDESVRNGFAELLERAGRVDHLVNNAGIGGNGVVEETPPSAYLDVMNVNLCGAVRCIQAVLPQMRERGSGTIVNVTSITGRFAAVAQQPYVASKWAFEGLSEGLAQELAPFGIRVVIIEPGVTKSAIFAKTIDVPATTGAYDAQYRHMFQFYAAGIGSATDPFEVGRVIHQAITTDEPQLRYHVSWGADELLARRPQLSDAEWVALGAIDDDAAYAARFEELFGLDIAPAAPA